jgi:hypothetical protein
MSLAPFFWGGSLIDGIDEVVDGDELWGGVVWFMELSGRDVEDIHDLMKRTK